MKTFGLIFAFLAILGFAGNIEAKADIDPMAHEVVMQTWYGKIPPEARAIYCDKQNAKVIIKRYNNKATAKGKRELRKAYKFYILNNC